MQLTKLEISGFKSFAKKTELIFKNGITGILGAEKATLRTLFALFWASRMHVRCAAKESMTLFSAGRKSASRCPTAKFPCILTIRTDCLLLRFPRLLLHAAPSVREKANTASTKPLHVCAISASFSVTQASARTDIPSSDRAA